MLNEALNALINAVNERLHRVGGSLEARLDLADIPVDVHRREPQAVSLPEFRFAARARPLPHVLLLSTVDVDGMSASLDSLYWWIASARRSLSVHERADLHAIIVVDGDAADRAWCSRLEIDDRLCRKLVFSVRHGEDVSERAHRFLDRTFFARPWEAEINTKSKSLDPIQLAASRFSVETGVTLAQAQWWLGVLARDIQDARDISDLLLTDPGDEDE